MEADSLPELSSLVESQNTRMDDMTFIYFKDSVSALPYEDLQLAFIQNETKHSVIRVTSPKVAGLLKLEHGKFYCVYKPSFANYKFEHAMVTQCFSVDDDLADEYETVRKYPNVADQLINRKYVDQFELDETFVESEDFQTALELNDFMLT